MEVELNCPVCRIKSTPTIVYATIQSICPVTLEDVGAEGYIFSCGHVFKKSVIQKLRVTELENILEKIEKNIFILENNKRQLEDVKFQFSTELYDIDVRIAKAKIINIQTEKDYNKEILLYSETRVEEVKSIDKILEIELQLVEAELVNNLGETNENINTLKNLHVEAQNVKIQYSKKICNIESQMADIKIIKLQAEKNYNKENLLYAEAKVEEVKAINKIQEIELQISEEMSKKLKIKKELFI